MNLSDYDYILPEELIAQTPIKKRDESKLLVLDQKTGDIEHNNRKSFGYTNWNYGKTEFVKETSTVDYAGLAKWWYDCKRRYQ